MIAAVLQKMRNVRFAGGNKFLPALLNSVLGDLNYTGICFGPEDGSMIEHISIVRVQSRNIHLQQRSPFLAR